MNLSETIEKIFETNSCYARPEQAVNQAESLRSLSQDLYTDSKRFIYELLQNADDSALPSTCIDVHIQFFDNIMLLAHTGQAFDVRDIEGLCSVSHGTKKKSINKTGYKGIGFKAVFGQSNKVIVYSNDNYFRFDENYDFEWRIEWGQSKSEWETTNDRKFLYPWQIIPLLTDKKDIPPEITSFLSSRNWNVATIVYLNNKNDIKNAVNELTENINMFLFLKNIRNIVFKTDITFSISIDRVDDKIEICQNNHLEAEWLVYPQQLNIPPEVKEQIKLDQNVPDKLKEATSVELSFAAKIEGGQLVPLEGGKQLLYAYLPTGERKYYFPILVNSSFLTSANRETLHENSVWNQWLFESIAIHLFEWIALLVKTQYQYQAYNLIPEKLNFSDQLNNSFNNGIDKALDSVPFIISDQGVLLTRNQAIQDFTFLSKKTFIGSSNIRQYIIERDNKKSIALNPFVAHTTFGIAFKRLGVSSFDWKDISGLLQFPKFKQKHTINDNIQLIKHFKYIIDKDIVGALSNKIVSSWEFIYDHKMELKSPSQIYFPEQDNQHWNDHNSEISFLHPYILEWLLTATDCSIWLENLGVIEKTDFSFLQKTILANPSTYTSLENAVPTIQAIYKLYLNREIGQESLSQLGELKILTKNSNLIAANQCYLSDIYRPRLPLEVLIAEDIFVSESYLFNPSDKDELRRFFKMMGVKEGVEIIKYGNKISVESLLNRGLIKDYFEKEDKRFIPFHSTFKADEYSKIYSLDFLQKTGEYNFSIKFWNDIIGTIVPSDIDIPAIAFWGYSGRAGRLSGDEVENYVKWYINYHNCIPTKMHNCRKATDVLINDESIIELVGNYLPVFDGPNLTSDWKSFFQFKTQLTLSDYLELLSNIAADTTEEGRIKQENKEPVQNIYKSLLDCTANWTDDEIAQVQEWVKKIKLPDKSNILRAVDDLCYYTDGDTSIFQGEFNFIFLNSQNRKHPYVEDFLAILKVKIFKQEKFNISYCKKSVSVSSLKGKLKKIRPYLDNWILSQEQTITSSKIEDLHEKIEKLEIYEVPELKITHENWEKTVQFHLKDDVLYVTFPWNSNVSLMYLPSKLCYYLGIKGFEDELDFLLRSEEEEIQRHFRQENIELPKDGEQISEIGNIIEGKKQITNDDLISLGIETADELNNLLEKDKSLSSSFFHLSTNSYSGLQYVQEIVGRAKKNIKAYLETIGYDCSEATEIAPSIFSGIKKEGKDIYVVTRPSDGDVVLLYYTSELDVLEYVATEFWYEDGEHTPKQITFGQLLKQTGINRIPVKNTAISCSDIEELFKSPKSEILDFDPVPYAPQKIARIISSFANTDGGTLVFGMREIDTSSNEVIGLSVDFDIVDITKKAISLLSPIPSVTYEYKKNGGKEVFIIKTEKSDASILFGDKKYIRKGLDSILEQSLSTEIILNNPQFKRTIAIIISIENYTERKDNQVSRVKYANKDASDFKQTLIDVLNVPENDIYIYQDEKALKSNLEYELKSLFYHLTADDRLIFYYVGHGFHDGTKNYLSTYDMHIFNIAGTAIPLQNILLDPLKKSKCNNALIFIDACAKSFINENERAQISDINDEELLILTEEFPNYTIFLSCQPGQSSYSCDVLQNGIWTYHLINAFSGGVKEIIKDGRYITDRSLSDYLSRNVAMYTKDKLKYDQNPRAILDSSYENVILETEYM